MTDLPSLDFVKHVGHDGPHLPTLNPEVHGDPYPAHTKLAAIRDRSQAVGDFLDWLQNEQHYTICEYDENLVTYDHGERVQGGYNGIIRPIDSWLAQYFGLDRAQLEREKRLMLERQRELNAQADAEAEAKGTT